MQPILRHLFKKNSLQDITVETLQQMTVDFPYFAVGQYLLTRKFQEIKEPAFEDQFQKALVYFHNPLWLQYKLSEDIKDYQPGSNTSEYKETTESADPGPSADIFETSHDMIEEVVLHQENNSFGPEVEPALRDLPGQARSAGTDSGNKDAETQTIQREEPFTFQAYYTVDYFASQGIKLGQDNNLQQDKLGKQLKSFTEWLKTMRRLPETSVVEILDKINDGEIATFAAHSLDEKEVITEAMAEVLVKQGKNNKARELYNKLSLQNPQKSAYFAAKIEDLKLY